MARWRASGKSVRAFAERHGLSAVTLYGWARTAREQAELQGFVEVQLPQVAEVTRATLGSIGKPVTECPSASSPRMV